MNIVGRLTMEILKKLIYWIDNRFNSKLFNKAIKVQSFYKDSVFINRFRININYFILKTYYKLVRIDDKKKYLKLNLGCGNHRIEGCINIDFRKTRAIDVVCNVIKLTYPDNSVSLIETYHAIEHLSRNELYIAIREWYRVLIVGGLLIIECPDFDIVVREYLNGNEQMLDSVFGNQRCNGDMHKFGYNFDRLKMVLETSGFKDVFKKAATDYHVQSEPCMRVECIRI